MKILYVAMKYENGRPELGCSFEQNNFLPPLLAMGHDIIQFDFLWLMLKHGQRRMNEMLLSAAEKHRPDLAFFVLFQNEVRKSAVSALTRSGHTKTINWFCDDDWRFDIFSKYWAPRFNWVATTHHGSLKKYEAIGYRNVIPTQWACNPFTFRRLELPMAYDVSFVGQPHGERRRIVDELGKAGITVHAFGNGWPAGRVGIEQMVQIFNQSRINLNFTGASRPLPGKRAIRQAAIMNGIHDLPIAPEMRSLGRIGRRMVNKLRAARGVRSPKPGVAEQKSAAGVLPVRDDTLKMPAQIKGRNFEVPGCGGFLLTGPAEGLDRYYEVNKEIACFSSVSELVEKIRFFLSHEEERRAIAEAGYARTIQEHTYVHRFSALFEKMGLPSKGESRQGALIEVE